MTLTEQEMISGNGQRTDEQEENWKRAAAEVENVRKRLTRDFERQRTLDREAVLRSFLPVADNLERALKADEGHQNPWLEGMKAIHHQMVETLKTYKVTAYDPKGDRFDPVLHEAAAVVRHPAGGRREDGGLADDFIADDIVADVLLTGYVIGDGERRRVLRPAKVTVLKKRG